MRTTVLVSIVLLLGTVALAQVPTSGNVFLGYSYYNTDLSSIDRANTNGWEASLEGRVFPHIGMVVDYSDHRGSQNFPFECPVGDNCPQPSQNITERNILFGPRVSASIGKLRPFGEAMFGLGHVNASGAGTDTSFATAVGGGIDYHLVTLVAWRVQADYVQTRFFGFHQNNIQLSTGISIHF